MKRLSTSFLKFIKENYSSKPTTKPAEPTTKPGTKPDRPSPIRRDRPSIRPRPKAIKKKPNNVNLSTFENVAKKFINLINKKGESIKKYIK